MGKKVFAVFEIVLLSTVVLLCLVGLLKVMSFETEVLWSEKASGWAQAIGSIATIYFAYRAGERQANVAHENAVKLRKMEVEGRNSNLLSMAAAMKEYAAQIASVYEQGAPNILVLHFNYRSITLKRVIDILDLIPVHELGSIDAIAALVQMKNSATYLHTHLDKDEKLTSALNAAADDDMSKRDDLRDVILMNCKLIQRYFEVFERELNKRPLAM